MAPTLCLITDRRRLARSLSLPLDRAHRALLEQMRGAIRGGIDVVQIREPDLDDRPLVMLVREIVAIRGDAPTHVLVNDRADIARAANADGVHLRESSMPAEDARRLFGQHGQIGRSVHDEAGARRSVGADYLVAGTLFETESKPAAAPHLGLDGLRRIVVAAGQCPVWAIGGVTTAHAASIVATGARGIAAIGGFIPEHADIDIVQSVEKLVKQWRFSFDSAVELS
jgi:thiamine-phosphate pyrophosphorylase